MSKACKWYEQTGEQGDVVISTRIRLARNLPGVPFPAGLNTEGRREVVSKVRKALEEAGQSKDFHYLDMAGMTPQDALSMVEHHLISPEFAKCEEGSGLLLKDDESISVMINEEDHIRMQVMSAGFQLDETLGMADALDTALDETLHFAFDDRLGYLTQCPTNLGTGMRASLMLHLPALQEKGAIQPVANAISKLGLTIRGLYGEGSKSEGAMYQISNQVTLGISEQAAIENLKSIANQIIREERAEREQMMNNPRFEDMVWRSLGILKTARLLTHDEFMKLISNVRVGVSMNLVPALTLDVISRLIHQVQPATIMAAQRREMEPAERDAERAKLVREQLADV